MTSKAENRALRKAQKRVEQAEKAARLRERPGANEARSEADSVGDNQARRRADPGSIFQMQMRWTIDSADRKGEWSWGVAREWGQEFWAAELEPKLQEFAKLTWAEIESHTFGNEGKRHRSHRAMDTEKICAEAQDRLLALERAYPDVLFRFRLGNLPRLWGVRVVNEFQVIWHDPTHQIYPIDDD